MKLKARPTTYKGIEMRSRLEAGFAAWLDKWEFDWDYEPRCFASPEGQYLPDFLIHNLRAVGKVEPVYVEVKPKNINQDDLNTALHRMRVIAASEPDSGLALVIPELHVHEYPCVFYTRGDLPWGTSIWTQQRGTPRLSLDIPLNMRNAPMADGFWGIKG